MKKKILIASSVVGFAAFVGLGFNTTSYQIDTCTSKVSKYVTAEYSELETGIDMNGDFYSETNYWSEPASEVFIEVVTNSTPVYPPMPAHDTSMRRESDFDNFKFHTDASLTVSGFDEEGRTVFTENISKATSCLNKLDAVVEVKTWYTITYGSNF